MTMDEDSNVGSKAIPKFASFHPKVPKPQPIKTGEKPENIKAVQKDNNVRRLKNDSRHHRKHRHGQTSDDNEPGHEGRHYEPGEERREKDRNSKIRDGEKSPDKLYIQDRPDIFIVDKIGDEANLTYGSLHRYNISAYHRSGAGSVIGLSSEQKIDRTFHNEKFLVISSDRLEQKAKRDKMVFKKTRPGRELRIKPARQLKKIKDPDASYIPFSYSTSTKRKRGAFRWDVNSSNSSDDASDYYRSIEGRAKPPYLPEDSDLEFNASSDEGDHWSTGDVELRKKSAELSQKVNSEPSNGEAWLALIDHQDWILYQSAQLARTRITNAERLSTADIKLSMYEKALNTVEDDVYMEHLLLGLLDEGAKLWDTRKLHSKWQTILKEHPKYIGLWIRFLDFQQTTFSTFKFDTLKSAFLDCLEILKSAILGVREDAIVGKLYSICAYVMLRLTLCMREAGFTELATAIWQALLEYNFCKPDGAFTDSKPTRVSMKSATDKFERFWESEVPRIGEEGSQGWSYFESNNGDPPEPRIDASLDIGSDESSITEWCHCERMLAKQARTAARVIDEVGEDDPYRVVLFSDIQPFLVLYPDPPSQAALIYAFLAFSHLPPPQSITSASRSWWTDSFVRNEIMLETGDSLRPWIPTPVSDSSILSELEDLAITSQAKDPFSFSEHYYPMSTDSLFGKPGSWFSVFDKWKLKFEHKKGSIDIGWVSRTLRTLVNRNIGGDEFAEYLLAFECSVVGTAAKKTAKALLKKKTSCLLLYNAFALIEYRTGSATTAESVLNRAITMSKTFDERSRQHTILLWRTLVWEFLESGESTQALQRLLVLPNADAELKNLANGTIVDTVAVLRAQQALVDGRNHALSLDDYLYATIHAELLILLTYLSNSLSLSAALSTFSDNVALFTNQLMPSSLGHELLHQSLAHLLYYHTTHTHAFKPAQIRSALAASIALFPQNTIFLSLYAANEARFRIDDRVRAIVNDVLLVPPPRQGINADTLPRRETIITHLFAIHTESHRSPVLGSNIHSTRATFERAVASTSGQHSAGLWKLYVLWECECGDPSKSSKPGEPGKPAEDSFQRAKAVFYRAIRACPWAKELYLLAWRLGMKVQELRGVYEMVVERELRVHVNLEDVFEELDAPRAKR